MTCDELVKRIAAVLQRHSVAFGYLFGSWAKGKTTPMSDVDVAVWLTGTTDTLRARLDLMRDLEIALSTEQIDVIVLNEAPLPLRFVVVRDGVLAFERDRKQRVAFEVATRRDFWDFEPRLRVYRHYLRQRIEAGEFSG